MLSKCANPACASRFLYLHQGRLFHLNPTPEVEAVGGDFVRALYERFWLCAECCQRMTLVWAGSEVRLVALPDVSVARPGNASAETGNQDRPKRRGASAGLHWR